jgi:hypothetical protein
MLEHLEKYLRIYQIGEQRAEQINTTPFRLFLRAETSRKCHCNFVEARLPKLHCGRELPDFFKDLAIGIVGDLPETNRVHPGNHLRGGCLSWKFIGRVVELIGQGKGQANCQQWTPNKFHRNNCFDCQRTGLKANDSFPAEIVRVHLRCFHLAFPARNRNRNPDRNRRLDNELGITITRGPKPEEAELAHEFLESLTFHLCDLAWAVSVDLPPKSDCLCQGRPVGCLPLGSPGQGDTNNPSL